MIFELCPTLSRDLIKREFLNTAAAFGVLVLLGFAAGMIFPDMAQQMCSESMFSLVIRMYCIWFLLFANLPITGISRQPHGCRESGG